MSREITSQRGEGRQYLQRGSTWHTHTHTQAWRCAFVKKTQPLLNANAFYSFSLLPHFVPDVTQRTVTLVTLSEEHVIVSIPSPLHLSVPLHLGPRTHTLPDLKSVPAYSVHLCLMIHSSMHPTVEPTQNADANPASVSDLGPVFTEYDKNVI